MSYEIVKAIKIKDGKVFLNSTANNDTEPFKVWECSSLSEILQSEGMQKLEVTIMKEYEGGMFKSYSGKYFEALKRLRGMDDYKKFDWRLSNYKDNCPIKAARESEAFFEILSKALNSKNPTQKYILVSESYGSKYYFKKSTSRRYIWTPYEREAKKFVHKNDIDCIVNNTDRKVIAQLIN